MKKLVAILLCSLMVTSAYAMLDEDADQMGVYFDLGGTVVCSPWAPIMTAYILYTNPSIPNTRGFECEVKLQKFDGTAVAGMWFPPTFPIAGQNLGTGGMFIVGYSAPIATSAATLLATIQYYSMEAPMVGYNIFLGEATPNSGTLPYPMVMLDDYSLMHVGLSVVDGPTAQLGAPECSVVPNEDVSFGAVKALFR